MNLDVNAVSELRARLWSAGYRPVPVFNANHTGINSPGKQPLGDKWQLHARMDPPFCVTSHAVPHALNTGVLADGLRPLDLDIDDPEKARECQAVAERMFGPIPTRSRCDTARVLLLCRAAEGEPVKRTLTGRSHTTEYSCKIEVLGRGQQFVAYGCHPSGAGLEWSPDGPGVLQYDELPEVTEDQIQVYLEACASIIDAPVPSRPNGHDHEHDHTSADPQADSLRIAAALAGIPNHGPADWESWNRVGMAVWRATSGSSAGWEAFNAWSQRNRAYDADATRLRWDHYTTSPPTSIGAGTIFHMAAEGARPARDSHAKPDAIWVDAEDWEEADIPPRPWIVPGYALRGAVTLIAGPPSALKSSLALGWASSVALNVGYGRFHPAISGPVFVYNVEDDGKEQRRRLSATLRQFGARPADIKNKLYRIGPSTIGTLLERCDDGRVRFTPAMDTLHTLIRMKRPVMLIVDPLAELHNCEENDNTALRAIIAKFREMAVEFEMAVVVLHHTRKGAGQSPGDPDAARGASAIIGAVRVAVTATTMSEDDAKAFGLSTDLEQRSFYVRMDDAKSNYAPLRSAQWFEKVAYELTNGDIVAAAVPWKPPEEKIASLNDLTVLAAAIERGAIGGEPWSPKLSGDPRSVRALLEQHGFLGTDAQRKTITRLEKEFGMTTAIYRRSRNKPAGLRIGDKPDAPWIQEE
jgi:hypothetical protein